MFRNLDKLCQELDQRYNVNNGGCCFVAYLIAKHLDKLNIKYELCVASDEELELALVIREVSNHTSNYYSNHSISGSNTCCHYYIHVIDSDEDINISNFCNNYDLYSINKINCTDIKWIYDTGSWNNSYNIDYNRLIERIINYWFKHNIFKNGK